MAERSNKGPDKTLCKREQCRIVGKALLEVARSAFVQGLHLVASISAVMVISAAIVAVLVFRGVPISSQRAEQPDLEPNEADAPGACR